MALRHIGAVVPISAIYVLPKRRRAHAHCLGNSMCKTVKFCGAYFSMMSFFFCKVLFSTSHEQPHTRWTRLWHSFRRRSPANALAHAFRLGQRRTYSNTHYGLILLAARDRFSLGPSGVWSVNPLEVQPSAGHNSRVPSEPAAVLLNAHDQFRSLAGPEWKCIIITLLPRTLGLG